MIQIKRFFCIHHPESHIRFREELGEKFPRFTRPSAEPRTSHDKKLPLLLFPFDSPQEASSTIRTSASQLIRLSAFLLLIIIFRSLLIIAYDHSKRAD